MEVHQDVLDLLAVVPATRRAMVHLHLRDVPDVLRAAQAVVRVLVEVVAPVPAVLVVRVAALVPVEVDAAPDVLARAVVDVVQDAPPLVKADAKGVVPHRVRENVAVHLAVEFVPMSVIEVSVMEAVKAHVRQPVKAPASTLAI